MSRAARLDQPCMLGRVCSWQALAFLWATSVHPRTVHEPCMQAWAPVLVHCAVSNTSLLAGMHACAGFDRQLLAAAQRQAQLTKGLPMETRRRRLVAWLQRRGHGWGTVSALLRELTL